MFLIDLSTPQHSYSASHSERNGEREGEVVVAVVGGSTETLNSLFSLCRSLGHALKTAQSHADVLSRSHRETNQ